MPGPSEFVHLAHSRFPADPRVKREVLATQATGRGVAVLALREDRQSPEDRPPELLVLRLPGRKARAGPLAFLLEYAAFTWRCRRGRARRAPPPPRPAGPR